MRQQDEPQQRTTQLTPLTRHRGSPVSGAQCRITALQRAVGNSAVAQLLANDTGATGDTGQRLASLAADMRQALAQANTRVDPGIDDPDGHFATLSATADQVEAAAGADSDAQLAVLAAFTRPSLETAEAQLLPDGAEPVVGSDSSDVAPVSVQTVLATNIGAPVQGLTVQRQLAEAMTALGVGLLEADATAAPVEAATGPPGWAVAGALALVGVVLIGAGVLMATAQPETLSDEEQKAIDDKEAGRPYDQEVYNRARQKQIKNEKYRNERNRRKQRSSG